MAKTLERMGKIRKYLQKSLYRLVYRLAISFRYGFGLLERSNKESKQRRQEMRELRRFHLLKQIHYEELLAERGGALRIYAQFAKKDRRLYRALYGEDPMKTKESDRSS